MMRRRRRRKKRGRRNRMRSTEGPPATCPEEKLSEMKLEQNRSLALPSLQWVSCVCICVKNYTRRRGNVPVAQLSSWTSPADGEKQPSTNPTLRTMSTTIRPCYVMLTYRAEMFLCGSTVFPPPAELRAEQKTRLNVTAKKSSDSCCLTGYAVS